MDRCSDFLMQYACYRNGSNYWKLRRMTSNARDLHDFKQKLSDDDELGASTISLTTVPNNDCDDTNAALVHLQVYSKDSAEELNNENLTAHNKVETLPTRHVSFAELCKRCSLILLCIRHLFP